MFKIWALDIVDKCQGTLVWDAFIDKSLVVSCDLRMTLEYLS